jgi:signal transduction histidine kinase
VTVICELVTDRHGVITGASREAAALFAIEDRWLLRKPLATFVARRDRQRFRSFLLELDSGRNNGVPHPPFVLETRSGTEIAADLAASREDGKLAWHVRADAEVTPVEGPRVFGPAAERLFERVLNRLPIGVLVVDRELKLVHVNPAARRFLGTDTPLRPGDALPSPWEELSLRDLAVSLFTHEPAVGRRVVEAGDRFVCVEGLTAAHMPTATLLIEDVTERERTRKAERRFVENAAHELRTPLAAIVSVVDALEGGAKDDPEAISGFLEHIRTHSERLTRLVTSLLVLARIQTGREQPRLDLVEVKPLLVEVASGLVPGDSVTIGVRTPDKLGVLADRDLIYQALENVAANAIKHTREGEIRLEARDLGRTIEIEVSDTGTGMDHADVAHAFDRFFRSATRDEQGFGLGLAIANEAVQALGGTINLDSAPEIGTRVRIRLPSAKIVS